MNVGELREMLAGLSDDATVLVPGSDHSYEEADASFTTALYDRKEKYWCEDYGEETTPEKEYGKRKEVLVIR